MKKKSLIFLLLFLSSLSYLGAQNLVCGTPDRAQMMADPEFAKSAAQMDAFIEEYIRNHPNEASANKTNASLKTKYVIPIVLHVVYGDPNKLGADSISLDKARSAFKALFNDFRKVPGTVGDGPKAVDYQVEFKLATKDPQGNPTTGVLYYYNPELTKEWNAANDAAYMAQMFWPRKNYLNVYLVGSIGSSSQGITLGYTRLPQNGSPANDGVVVRYDTWGTLEPLFGGSTQNKVATHEFGHWLNLWHPFDNGFSQGCGNTSCQTSGDQVCDTPPSGQQNFGAGAERQNTCSNDNPDLPDEPRNFMDYLSDSYKNFFTAGQRVRTWAALNNANFTNRFFMWQDNNLQATGTGPYGPPMADFVANERNVCPGTPVTFEEYSMGMPDKFQWYFEGGSPETSAEASPVVTWSAAGSYDVRLIVENKSGTPDTILYADFITVSDYVEDLPFAQNFNDAAFPPANWLIKNPDGFKNYQGGQNPSDVTWTRHAGSQAARMRLGSYTDKGQKDGLITPSLNVKKGGKNHAAIIFDVQYAPLNYSEATLHPRPFLYSDTLSIKVTADCGANWTTVYKKGGIELSTYDNAAVTQTITLPDAQRWRTDSVSLDEFVNEENLRVMFETTNGWGNFLFIDNVAITYDSIAKVPVDTGTARVPLLANGGFTVAPNPFAQTAHVQLELTETAALSLKVVDIQGKTVYEQPAARLPYGSHRFELNFRNRPAGVYTVIAQADGQVYTQKIIHRP